VVGGPCHISEAIHRENQQKQHISVRELDKQRRQLVAQPVCMIQPVTMPTQAVELAMRIDDLEALTIVLTMARSDSLEDFFSCAVTIRIMIPYSPERMVEKP
jgi:hypothetical protein